MRRPWRTGRWFLPEVPDLLGKLVEQAGVSVAAAEAFEAWARGQPADGERVRALEHEADALRREVMTQLRQVFMTPIEPEDLFELSERLDNVINQAKDLVRESDVLGMRPDRAMAEMAGHVLAGVRELAAAIAELVRNPDGATAAADRAVREHRAIERIYRHAMSDLLRAHDAREIGGRRELYRRFARTGEAIEHVAHRVWYSVVKEA